MKSTLFSLIGFLIFTQSAFGQNEDRLEYIRKYKDIAIQEMIKYKIPASITLAQGILESGNGTSRLAKEANNHFGIKCHLDWEGKKIFHDDDEKNECFRKYKTPEESFRDHSLFLVERGRYKALFDLEITDYKGWAKGLKKAGYATSPTYADVLIRIIEDYQLYVYDAMDISRPEDLEFKHASGLRYTLVQEGETLEEVSDRTRVSIRRIIKYNDFTYEEIVAPGDVIFLQQKRNRGKTKYHIVNPGEGMHDISQLHGIKLRKLYYRNRMLVGEQPEGGDKIHLRWRIRKSKK
ncbi:MAG: glucosaminidase domain-containing protein [Cryomorphaceae bacterium]|nr:glucosaminidase domain-containing protein [Cryomorphaceae bacterium]